MSYNIVNDKNNKIIDLADLKTNNMTRKVKPKPNERGAEHKNNTSAKAGLNKSILNKGCHQLEDFINYKAERARKVMSPNIYTSAMK